ncbi:MAG: threonylcarbamoyl-AMP synthase [Pseudomonadales bacterium]|nr:threonylcarbamoyl-AMP synthase [Candidatus Woesebacteria bacterium]MCB9801010.1 threonylcarbamoyl-AMP synthase [Pseudomonadales bacterium]
MQIIDCAHTPVKDIISTARKVLSSGGLVIFPTETTYGAGVDATNPVAIEKLLAYKSRREGKPLSIAVTDKEMARTYVEINDQADQIISQFLPGPVTVVCKDKGVVSPGVASEFGTLGLRIPDYQLILDIVAAYGKPMTATSANASGKKRPYTVQDILDNLSNTQKEKIDLILDAGKLPHNPPSTVIDTTLETPITLRQGEAAFNAEMTQKAITQSEQETMDLAGKIALQHWNDIAKTGLIIALDGPLGVGKTIFTKGIAKFLGITETITSPTYAYVEEYDYTRHQTSGRLYHADIWKVASAEEASRLGIDEMLGPNSLLLVEWFDVAKDYILSVAEDKKVPVVHIQLQQDGTKRILHISDIETTSYEN